MSDLITRHICFFHLFTHTSSTQRRALMSTITRSQLTALSEVAHNVIQGIIPLAKSEKYQLHIYKHLLIKLGDKHYRHKRKLIHGQQDIIFTLIKVALAYLKPLMSEST
jgi:hypothetical protein